MAIPVQQEPLFIIMLGAPGAGKGTQARLLSEALNLPQISSGDIFRENLKNATPLGLLAKKYMDTGALVPDDVTIAMVIDRLTRADCANGAILDGFPRTLPQADALDKSLAAKDLRVQRVPLLEVERRSGDQPPGGTSCMSRLPGHVSGGVQPAQGRGRLRRVRRPALPAQR